MRGSMRRPCMAKADMHKIGRKIPEEAVLKAEEVLLVIDSLVKRDDRTQEQWASIGVTFCRVFYHLLGKGDKSFDMQSFPHLYAICQAPLACTLTHINAYHETII